MRRGTTPTITLTVTNSDGSPCDLTGQEIHVTFESGGCRGRKLIKSGDDLAVSLDGGATVIDVTLTQAETLSFREGGSVRVQVRCIDPSGKAQATDIASFTAGEILEKGEI